MPESYRMSFTSADLKLHECLTLAEAYHASQDWDVVRARVKEENLLQTRTVSSARRYAGELIPRLQTLSADLLDYLLGASYVEQRLLLWVAVCRRYAFVHDFAVEVLVERHRALAPTLTDDDFWRFFNAQADWHPELDGLSDSTKTKIREVLYRMLVQAGLLAEDRAIVPVLLSASLRALVGGASYAIFPLVE